ncbi:uncharacterized protein RCC_06771 [Ramularia collo-cygni]|uniref:SAP domain-containing protein n=1 Tax=Ramularia collo-cygni TaxID=112498 RepID=A0A2D3UVZ4_9PEZI|nr:uncharacterized protein RCC_06771 [Ramularia collo-cygni]CZT20911.1 uncharacterized protein RCC_06771 [Ramularia collo-cygni]
MAAPRATSFIALRNLAKSSASGQHARFLHMTGPQTYSSPSLHRGSNLPRDLAGLRAECKRRKIETSGAKSDLVARITADEIAHSRSFSTETRPSPSASTKAPVTRHFNTSRTLKAVNDSSTIDFAFMPQILGSEDAGIAAIRVPILPDINFNQNKAAIAPEEPAVMLPQISTMSADAVILPLSDHTTPSDEYLHIDFRSMADRVSANLANIKLPVEQQAGMVKRIFGDMIDDAMGIKRPIPA